MTRKNASILRILCHKLGLWGNPTGETTWPMRLLPTTWLSNGSTR
jgi:hypothetical protein